MNETGGAALDMDDAGLKASMSPDELRRHMRSLGYRTQSDLAGAIGVAISRINRERSLGRIVDGARRLNPAERELVAADISRRLTAALQAAQASVPPAAAAAPLVPPQMPTVAEP